MIGVLIEIFVCRINETNNYSREMLALTFYSSVYLHNVESCSLEAQCNVGDEMQMLDPVATLSLTLVAKNSNLSIIQMQKILLLTADIKSKPFSNSALPRRAKLFVKRVLNESRCTFVIVRALELVDCHCCDVYDVISHFGRQVRVLKLLRSD